MQIKIAVIVGSDGSYVAGKFDGENTDWAFLSDIIGTFNEKTHEVIYPPSERRYIVTAEIELPTLSEVMGWAEPAPRIRA